MTDTIVATLRPVPLYPILKPIKYLFLAALFLTGAYFVRPYLPEEPLKYAMAAITTMFFILYLVSYLHLNSIRYTVTDEQILFKRGIFTITTDYIELYRIQDFKVIQGFLLRFINAMSFRMDTIDKSHPVFLLHAIPKSNIDGVIRNLVEQNRARKNVYVTE